MGHQGGKSLFLQCETSMAIENRAVRSIGLSAMVNRGSNSVIDIFVT